MATTKARVKKASEPDEVIEPAWQETKKYADDDRSADAELWRLEQEHEAMHARQARGEPPQ